ncbi:MAG: NUDIX hydrolase [Niallia nealsonii]|nr:NUDIX hydrolase [Niallia nealsonii]
MGYIEDLRKLVGKMPLILVGAVVILLDKDQKVLLQERKHPKNVWGLPGGLMEIGESTEETAKREVFEETGLQVTNLQLLSVYSGKDYFAVAANGDPFYTVTTTYCTSEYEGKLENNHEESFSLQFFPLHNLPEKMVGSHRRMIEDFKISSIV